MGIDMVGLVALGVFVLTPPVLTVLGARRRGLALPRAVVAGVFFPITWTVWYLRDEHPYRRADGSF
jgi:hypothetical protein